MSISITHHSARGALSRVGTWTGRLVAAAVLVCAAPAIASAAPALNSTAKQMPKSASRDYKTGQAAYDSGKYSEAGQSWANALDKIPEEPKHQGKRADLILDVMVAYTEAYRQSGDVAELEAGLEHYFRYFGVWKSAYGNPRIPRAVVDARYELRDLINDAKAEDNGGAAAAAAGAPAGPNEDPAGDNEDPPPGTDAEDERGSEDPGSTDSANSDAAPAGQGNSSGSEANVSVSGGSQGDRAGTPLIAAGAAVLAIGVGASSMIAVGSIEGKRAREEQHTPGLTDEQLATIDKRGKTMNSLFIAGLVVTPVLVGGGAALLGVGVSRSRKRGHHRRRSQSERQLRGRHDPRALLARS